LAPDARTVRRVVFFTGGYLGENDARAELLGRVFPKQDILRLPDFLRAALERISLLPASRPLAPEWVLLTDRGTSQS
jgi:hypothetical protein